MIPRTLSYTGGVSPPSLEIHLLRFADLDLGPHLLARIQARAYESPTPVQAQAIPLIKAGQDVLIQSQTGSGKTLAYLLPLLARLDPAQPVVQALIVAPTRELAMQILHEAQFFAEGTPLRVQQLIGGANVRHQLEKLKQHPQLVVGTPGRLAELVAGGKLKLHGIRIMILDEVDTLVGDTFRDDVIRVLKATSRERQTLFASATMGPAAMDVARRWMREPQTVQITEATIIPSSLTHLYMVCEARHKTDTLRRLLHAAAPRAALVFVNEGARVEETLKKLTFKGMKAGALLGSAHKLERGEVLRAFRDGKLQVMLASEVAARGLDLAQISHVVNLDLPTDADHYLHRAGRAGRMGAAGTVISLISPAERFALEKQAKALGLTLVEVELHEGQLVPVPGRA